MRSHVLPSLLALSIAGCFYPAERGRALETRVQRIEGENEALRAELDKAREQLATTLPRVDAKIVEVTSALEGLDKASRRSDADTGVQLQKTIEDVAQLRGQVEMYLHKMGELEAALAQAQGSLEQKMTQLQGPEAIKAAQARKKLESLERPAEPKAFYELAAQQAKAGEPEIARQLYTEFLKKWPKHALAASAHYALGEAWRGDNKCREALFEYGKVIQDHPKAEIAPSAYLRSAECFKKLDMKAEARLALEEVVRSYPKSDAAQTARKQLEPAKPAPKKKGSR